MSAIPQDWIEAGAQSLAYANLRYGNDIAEAVLTAALPLIREAIAQQIEEKLGAVEKDIDRCATWHFGHRDPASVDPWQEGETVGLRHAARIARGGAL